MKKKTGKAPELIVEGLSEKKNKKAKGLLEQYVAERFKKEGITKEKFFIVVTEAVGAEFKAGDILEIDPRLSASPGAWALKVGRNAKICKPASAREARNCIPITRSFRETMRGSLN